MALLDSTPPTCMRDTELSSVPNSGECEQVTNSTNINIYYDILDGEFFVDNYYVEGEERLDCAQLDAQGRRDLIALAVTLTFVIFLFLIFSWF